MAILQLKVPHDMARILHSIDVPGDKEDISSMHITLIYFEDLSISDYFKAAEAVYSVTSRTAAFEVRTSRIGSFPPSPERVYPVIAHVESEELLKLRADLATALDVQGVAYSKKFPEYRPHVTLSYSPTAQEEKKVRPLPWGVGELYFWGGERGDDRISTCFPFERPAERNEIYRMALRSLLGKRGSTLNP